MIRVLGEDDLDAWLSLRLDALLRHPENFLTSHAEVSARPRSAHVARLQSGAIWGAFDGDTLTGMIACDRLRTPGTEHRAQITSFYVAPDHRGGGQGRRLLEFVSTGMEGQGVVQLELQVAVENTSAIRFYEAAGFQRFGTFPRQVVRDGRCESDYFMVRFLDGWRADA
ncbi:GNAT family N-acetyltransferase [Celeribacter arenosi]|uniref:GNAT family N-acetyltransferase n=1 Tax=Celeribacter arenosi TaxID=792649 RepID=A0ABP7K6F5_9RHOB